MEFTMRWPWNTGHWLVSAAQFFVSLNGEEFYPAHRSFHKSKAVFRCSPDYLTKAKAMEMHLS
jgi:hypothetical protein